MYVPSFVPPQIAIPNNAAESPYEVRLGFIRRVASFHFLTGLLIAGMAVLPLPSLAPMQGFGLVLALLVLLSLVRGLAKGRQADVRYSLCALPVLLLAAALWLRALFEQGFGVWGIGVGLACAVIYTWVSGRDLSFVGMFVLSAAVSSLAILAFGWKSAMSRIDVAATMSLNAVFLFYYVYDLAALLTRRRTDEEWGAVVDLYRDLLNGFAYPIRVYCHWRDHRIWNPR